MKVQIGTIIKGTARPEDLIPAFTDMLEKLEEDSDIISDARELMENYDNDLGEFVNISNDGVYDILTDLMDALEGHAPPFCYFGTLEGDATDYGFWPDMDAVTDEIEMRGISFTGFGDGYTLLPEDGFIVHINYHGNVAIFAIELGKEIWSVV